MSERVSDWVLDPYHYENPADDDGFEEEFGALVDPDHDWGEELGPDSVVAKHGGASHDQKTHGRRGTYFHATTRRNLDRIRTEGLVPRDPGGKVWLFDDYQRARNFADQYDAPHADVSVTGGGVVLAVDTVAEPRSDGIPGALGSDYIGPEFIREARSTT